MKEKFATREKRPVPLITIKALRLSHKLTMEQVCERIQQNFPELALNKGTISAIESGTRGMSDLMAIAIARAFDLPDDALILEYEPKRKSPHTVTPVNTPERKKQ